MSKTAIDPAAPLVVMYHYIWPARPPEPSGVRPLLVEEFEEQLDLLQSRYDICSADEFLNTLSDLSPLPVRRERVRVRALPIAAERPSPHPSPGVPAEGAKRRGHKPPCLLTFDDGTLDHATIVTPILARRGLSGVFFVLSGPAMSGIMPLTHAVHWALSVGDEAVWKSLADSARDAAVDVGDEAQALRMYHYEPPMRARIKYATNVALPAEVTARALGQLADARGTPLQTLARNWFASEEQLADMHRAGMTLGVHGHTHRSLQQMGDGVRGEMQTCAAMIRRCTGAAPKWWACPFGGSGADESLHGIMRAATDDLGLIAGVGTEARSVSVADGRRSLPRVDCIHLPPRSGATW